MKQYTNIEIIIAAIVLLFILPIIIVGEVVACTICRLRDR